MRLLLLGLVVVGLGALLLSYLLVDDNAQSPLALNYDAVPEIETSQSYGLQFLASLSSWALDDYECEEPIALVNIPQHMLHDQNGQSHNILELIKIVHSLNCHLGDYPSNQDEAIELVQGRVVTADDGTVLDGSKQFLRAYAISGALDLFKTELSVGPVVELKLVPSNEENHCKAIIDIALNGSTLEMRFAAFMALIFHYPTESDHPSHDECPKLRTESDDVLIEQTKAGDIDAAVNLGQRTMDRLLERMQKITEDLNELPMERRYPFYTRTLRFMLMQEDVKIAEASGRYPLLALAYATGSGSPFLRISDFLDELMELEPLYEEIFEKYDIELPVQQEAP